MNFLVAVVVVIVCIELAIEIENIRTPQNLFFPLPLPVNAANKMKMFLIGKPICGACFVTLFYFYYLDGTRYHETVFSYETCAYFRFR